MTYQIAKQVKQSLEKAVDVASLELSEFDKFKGPMGLTPDNIKNSPEFRRAKNKFDNAFQVLRKFNAKFNKQYKTEIKIERANKMREMMKTSPFKI